MTALIPVTDRTINYSLVPTVNARDLHQFLGVNTRFNDWIRNRIDGFGFSQLSDFTTLTENLVSGGTCLEYFISLDMAKELSMVERNEKGKQARLYFIDCEKRLNESRATQQFMIPRTMAEALQLAADQAKQLEEQAPKVALYDKAMSSKDTISIGDVAKIINKPNLGQNNLFKFLEEKEVLYRDGGGRYLPYQAQMNAGRFQVKEQTWGDGDIHINRKVVVTQKGLEYILNLTGGNV